MAVSITPQMHTLVASLKSSTHISAAAICYVIAHESGLLGNADSASNLNNSNKHFITSQYSQLALRTNSNVTQQSLFTEQEKTAPEHFHPEYKSNFTPK